MAQLDTAPLTAKRGYVLVTDYTGTNSGAEPTLAQLVAFCTAGTLPTKWDNIGHTSQDNLLTPKQDGGDIKTSGSWQKDVLRSSQDPVIESFAIPSIQVRDNQILSWYYGGGTYATANRFVGPSSPAPVEKRICLVLQQDDTNAIGLYWPKCAISRADAWSADKEKPTELPLQFTRLDQSGEPPFVWIGAGLGTA